jgi:CRP/FNR family transcriptional regulator, cyclic AMP receptor protein
MPYSLSKRDDVLYVVGIDSVLVPCVPQYGLLSLRAMLNVNALRSISILSRLSDEELHALKGRLKPLEARKNSVVMRSGNAGAEMLLIVSGGLRVFASNEKGREITIARLSAGDFVGEISLLTGAPRSANVIATSRTSLLQFSREDFIKHVGQHTGLVLSLCQSLAERVRLASGKLADMALLDVPQRLVRTLERMSQPCSPAGHRKIEQRPTHQELADLIGTSREVVSRSLKALEEHGVLQIDGKVVVLLPQRGVVE